MSIQVARPLPGIRFLTGVEHPGEVLPRMDVACFLGFAHRGPVDVPVALENPAQFDSVFGLEQSLAWDPIAGKRLHAHLRQAVHQFFANGGRRCWVVRVLDFQTARKRHFALPNLLEAGADGPLKITPVSVRARDFGSWADDLRVSTKVERVGLRCVGRPSKVGTVRSMDLRCLPASDLRQGDVLQARLDERTSWFLPVASVERADNADPRIVRAVLEKGLAVRRLVEDSRCPSGDCRIALFDRADGRLWTETRLAAKASWRPGHRLELGLHLEPEHCPAEGSLIRIRWNPGAKAWGRVVESRRSHESLATGKLSTQLLCEVWEVDVENLDDDLDRWMEHRAASVDRLRMSMRAEHPEFVTESDSLEMASAADSAGSGFPLDLPVPGGFFFALGDPEGFGTGVGPLPDPASALERDGLGSLDGQILKRIFLDSDLCGELAPNLMRRAQQRWDDAPLPRATPEPKEVPADPAGRAELRAVRDRDQDRIRRGRTSGGPRGIHAMLASAVPGPSDEATLVAVVDAVHPGWAPVRKEVQWWRPMEKEPVPLAPPDEFRNRDTTEIPLPDWDKGAPPDADGRVEIAWHGSGIAGGIFCLEESVVTDPECWVEVFRGESSRHVRVIADGSIRRFRVREARDGIEGDWSARLEIRRGTHADETTQVDREALASIHRALLRVACARGDVMALLSAPRSFKTSDLARHAATLREVSGGDPEIPAIGFGEAKALAQGMLSHPWIRTTSGGSDHHPPDGALAGLLARTALAEGAWISPGRQILTQAVGLHLCVSDADLAALREAGVSSLGVSPAGVFPQWSDTLSRDPDDQPVNVRRFLGMLRRLCMQRGTQWVFEPAGPALVRKVERSCQRLMEGLHKRGALRGTGEGSSWRVDVQADPDAGQLRVDLGVAPSVPLTWLTVRLSLLGERFLSEEVA